MRGSVVDELGHPIADARISLCALDGAWRDGLTVARIEREGERREGFEVRTRVDGSFEFAAPAPSSSWIELRAEHGFARVVARRTFGGAQAGATDLLVVGENQLEPLVLCRAGWVRGRVVDESGTPIPDAEVGAYSADATGTDVEVWRTRTDASGEYELPSVSPGECYVYAQHAERGSGYVSDEVEAGRPSPVDFVLEAPRVRGLVVDPAGRPLEGVTLVGTSTSSCMIAQVFTTSTRPDGSFAFDFSNKRNDEIGFTRGKPEWVAANARDAEELRDPLRLVLDFPTRASLLVLDARNGRRLTDCVARAITPPDAWWSEPTAFPSLAGMAPFRSELRIDPARSWLQCEAPGYAPHEAPIAFDSASRTSASVRLQAGSRVRGRCAGLSFPSVRLVGLGFPPPSFTPVLTRAAAPPLNACRKSSYLGRPRTRIGEADGSFEFDSLAAGWYELRAQAAGEWPRVIESFWLGPEAVLDLGELRGASEADAPR